VRDLIDHSSESQLSIELASECLSLAPWNHIPAVTLLDRLKRSRRAWQTLQPTRKETLPLQGDIYLTYEVCGSMVAQGKPGQGVYEPTEFDPFATRMLEFWEMPVGGVAVDADIDRGRHRKYEDMGMDVVDFTFDASQDALLLVEKQGFVHSILIWLLRNFLLKIEVHLPPANTLCQPAPSERHNDRDGNGRPSRIHPV
jgi:hypothetical protein